MIKQKLHNGKKGLNPRSVSAFVASAALLASAALSSPAYAQRQPHTFFRDVIKLTDAEVGRIDQGQVVTKVLESKDKYGILVFGAVYINAPIEKFVAVYRDVGKLEEEKVYLVVQEFGRIGSTPKLADFDRFELVKGDIDAIEDCAAGDCDMQLAKIEDLQKEIDWKSKDKYAQANMVVRRRILEGMTHYMTGGLKALGSYRDREKPLDLYQATKDMVDSSYYLPKDKAPDVYRHVIDYPAGKMRGAEDIFYWENIDFGQGPVIRVNHVSVFPKGVGAVKLVVANKQLYSSKYIRVALQMFYCISDTQNPDKPGFYLIEMNDSRLPDFGGLKLSIVRKIATSTSVGGTRDTIEILQRRITKN
jgi:hypothetical protein